MKNKDFLVKSALMLSLIGALSTGCKKEAPKTNINVENVTDITDSYYDNYMPNPSNIKEVINGDTLPEEYSKDMYVFIDKYQGTQTAYKVEMENGKITNIKNSKILLVNPKEGLPGYNELKGKTEVGITKEEMDRLKAHYENDFNYLEIKKVESISFYRGPKEFDINESMINGYVYYLRDGENVLMALKEYFESLEEDIKETLDMSIGSRDYQVYINSYGKVIDVKIYDMAKENGENYLGLKELPEFTRQDIIDHLNKQFDEYNNSLSLKK